MTAAISVMRHPSKQGEPLEDHLTPAPMDASPVDSDGTYIELERVDLIRTTDCSPPRAEVCHPTLRAVIQGGARMVVGGSALSCTKMQAFLIDEETPASFEVTKASIDSPFYSISIGLDVRLLQDLLREVCPIPWEQARIGSATVSLRGPLADCVLCLVQLLDLPKTPGHLSASILHELHFWLLSSRVERLGLGSALGHRRLQRIAAAIRQIYRGRHQALRLPLLAREAAMSQSNFHKFFKRFTSVTPIQYQKRLRLFEARHLLVTHSASVTDVSHTVGYKSRSQFSREYARLFGVSPTHDVRSSHGSRSETRSIVEQMLGELRGVTTATNPDFS